MEPPEPAPRPEELSLLAGVPDSTVADWEKSAAAVLRKAGRLGEDEPDSAVRDRLTRTTLDGVGILPLGTPADAEVPPTGLPGQTPFTRGTAAVRAETGWDIRAAFTDPDATTTNEAVLADLANGVSSLWLTVGARGIAATDLPTVLDGVFLDLAPVVLDAPEDPIAAADALIAVLAEHEVTPAPGTNLGADPIGDLARRGRDDVDAAAVGEVVVQMAERATKLPARAIVVDGTAVQDGGASDAQELGYSLAAGAAYLRILTQAGHSVEDALSLLEFRYAAGDEQFTTIAKFRAARRLWHRVAELSGAAPESRGQLQHAVTSRPMMSKYDPYVNMLRTTVAAFAAGTGGATAVTVLPFDAALGLPDRFSRRIARNTSSLLISESHVATVTDPAGGSYAVERLTDDLARAAWQELDRIESAGGILAAIGDGSLAARHRATAEERLELISKRTMPITGVSEFPNLHETLPERRPYPEGHDEVARYGAPFETLRDDPADTPVFLATMGTIAQHTARASFAINLFAAGGVDTRTAGATDGVDDVVSAYEASGRGPVVCLTGNDNAYAEWGADLVGALREAGARWVILAGEPRDGLEVDDSAAAGVHALEFLANTRHQLETGVSA